MAPGSIRGSIFALMAAAMGTGLLALPRKEINNTKLKILL